ncbi:MAG: sugar ABC transporter ATP-binding protein [Clostridia bacterium]|nr:sugar ABC transporter ATP-binding protein [Clostridia bacterium]
MTANLVEMRGITKSFPGVRALQEVDFSLRPGEVHALLGENGAGKSTLVKILSGVFAKDGGTVRLFGQIAEHLTPLRAQELGVAIIHQELNLCQHLTVTENIFLGREIVRNGRLCRREMTQAAREVLGRLNIALDPDTIVGNLAISKQQMVEIAKALATDAKVLIMDEPTSALTAKEIDDLFIIIHRLRKEGRGIIYISHRLDELQHIVDRVTILRDGEFITCTNLADTTLPEIIANMVGREINEKFPRVTCKVGKTVFEVKRLNAGRLVRNVSLSLREGEIVGIAGLMGAGRTETMRAIFGVDATSSGEIWLDGSKIDIRHPEDAIKRGVVLVPEDRKRDGLCTRLVIRENIALPNLDILCGPTSFVRRDQERKMANKAMEDLRIKAPHIDVDAASLSGGNQQKVVLGKWLARQARVVIFDEPTRGIDVAAKVEIYNLMNDLKQRGIAILFVSSEMPEILGISDRIIVMCDGRVTGEMPIEDATQEKIMELATQFEVKQ